MHYSHLICRLLCIRPPQVIQSVLLTSGCSLIINLFRYCFSRTNFLLWASLTHREADGARLSTGLNWIQSINSLKCAHKVFDKKQLIEIAEHLIEHYLLCVSINASELNAALLS